MKISLKKPSIIIAIITTIILILALVFIPKTSMFSSLTEKLNLKEGTEEEVSLDNWEISTVFYDSTVDEGKTPLTEINWDASDGGYGAGETRIITVQINYKNTNAVTTYQPGELEISIPNLTYDTTYGKAQWNSSIRLGANDANNSGYDWNYSYGSASSSTSKLAFTNANLIEEKTNFEGSIQIVYTITPSGESPETNINECLHEYNKTLSATIRLKNNKNSSEIIESNELYLEYKRKYEHPWKKRGYSIYKSSGKITSFDGLPSNANEYYWVKYTFSTYGAMHTSYPYLSASYYIEDQLPEGCIVFDRNLNKVDLSDGKYIDSLFGNYSDYETSKYEYIYVGYPKSKYTEELNNTTITNNVDLYIKYNGETEYVLSDTADVKLDLKNYEFTYPSKLYEISKKGESEQQNSSAWDYSSTDIMYQRIIKEEKGGKIRWTLYPKTFYTGTPLTIEVGDDFLYATNKNGEIEKANDNDFYYEGIYVPCIYNKNGAVIKADKYNMKLFVRYANTDEFVQYGEDFKNHSQTIYSEYYLSSGYKSFIFEENEKVVAWYIQIEDMTEGISSFNVKTEMRYTNKDINESGTFYNYAYLQVFSKNESGELVLLNPTEQNTYNSFATTEIAEYDLQKYNNYIQRIQASKNWSYYEMLELYQRHQLSKEAGTIKQDAEREVFTGSFKLKIKFGGQFDISVPNYILFEQVQSEQYNTNFTLYDLLPKGMKLISTSEDIKESIASTFSNKYNMQGELAFKDKNSTDFFKEHTEVIITDNWNNTGRTKLEIKVNFHDYPLLALSSPYCRNSCAYGSNIEEVIYTYNYEVSYDSFLEYGNSYLNRVYETSTDEISNIKNSSLIDNGEYDIDSKDINNNGKTEDKLIQSTATATIKSVVSTHQDTTTYVKTDKSNHSTGVVEASYGSDYEYKLRARTGSSDVTNLILYTNIEEGHNGRGHWKGEFLGIDTTYAESKGYTIKTYYSENQNATNMKDDTSWKEYNDSIDKTKVKSLAFVFQDSEGKPAVLPANSLTYILIKMKAPSNENIKTLAYNNSWTEWNAIDSITKEPVDFITGINSNTVKISLPNSVQYEDIEINLEKIWNDNNNELGLRPNEITYKLISNGDTENATEIVLNTNDISLTDSNIWTKTIEVPKYDDEGEVIEYTINEVTPTLSNGYAYIKKIDNLSITNELGKTLTITKKWIDNSNSYLTRPSNVVIKVLQNNKEYETITITGDYTTNEWSNSITVPVYDTEGNEYTYTLEELKVDNYSTTYDSTNLTFTNKLTGEEKITITKKWLDNSNQDNKRPLSINVILKQNNKDYKNITITGTSNTWTSEEITIPKYDDNGIKYNYTIEESITLNNYGLIEYDQSNYTITNSLKYNIDITITKNWIDSDNEYNTRPKELKLTLLQNGKEYKTIALNGTTNTWITTVEVPKYDDNQKEYQYSIKEIDDGTLPDYKDIIYSEDGLSVTNKLNKDIDLIITKKWIDYDNEYKTRPDTIKINLLRNGEIYKELELSGNTNIWTTTVENIPVYDENSKKYIYTIEELPNDKINKYQKITYDQTTLTVTNELTEKPKVTLYFTVKNGYTTHDTDEVKFDSEGLTEILKKYDLNPDDEYIYEFELENTETKKVYKGNLSTQGVLEFPDLPYGTYRALQKDDEYFDFVKMINLEDVPGVSFTEDARGGIIKIAPTGEDIIYGVNVVNKITIPKENPETENGISIKIIILVLLLNIFIYKSFKKKNYA